MRKIILTIALLIFATVVSVSGQTKTKKPKQPKFETFVLSNPTVTVRDATVRSIVVNGIQRPSDTETCRLFYQDLVPYVKYREVTDPSSKRKTLPITPEITAKHKELLNHISYDNVKSNETFPSLYGESGGSVNW